jgi:sulfonate transport system permease protein
MPRITDVPLLPPASTAPDQAAEHPAPAPPATAPGRPKQPNQPQQPKRSQQPKRPKRPERHRGHAWARLVSPVAVVLLWQLVSSAGLVSAQKLPPPVTVWRTAVSLVTTDSPAYGTLQGAMLVSLQRMAIGFAFGAVAAVGLALVAGLSRVGEDAVDPLMQILRTLPLFGLIPVFIVWFGIGELPKVILIALGAAIPLYLNTFAGIRGVDARLAEAGRALGLRRTEMIRHVILPGALPQALTGLRQSLGVAWLALVVAEQVNANAGLGFIISQATQFLRNDVILVALAVYAALGLITDALVRLLERKALAWRRGLLSQ